MPSDKPDDMNNGFTPRQLAQLDERFKQADDKVDERFKQADDRVDERFKHADDKVDERFKQVDERFKQAEEQSRREMNAMFEHYFGLVKALFEPVYAKLEELTTVKPRVDTLVAAELPSRVDRLERKVFRPTQARRAATKRSRGRRG